MAERLKLARERSKQRKELLKHTLGVDDLSAALGSSPVKSEPKWTSQATSKPEPGFAFRTSPASKPGPSASMSSSSLTSFDETFGHKKSKTEAGPGEEEFRDSTAFLKGTQSLNPHNDYSQNFVDTGQRPQNFIRDVGLADRFFSFSLQSYHE